MGVPREEKDQGRSIVDAVYRRGLGNSPVRIRAPTGVPKQRSLSSFSLAFPSLRAVGNTDYSRSGRAPPPCPWPCHFSALRLPIPPAGTCVLFAEGFLLRQEPPQLPGGGLEVMGNQHWRLLPPTALSQPLKLRYRSSLLQGTNVLQ